MGCQRTPTLCDDIGMRQVVLVGGIHEGVDTVVDVFLDTIVYGTLTRRRARAVIIYTKTTTAIHEVHVIAHLMQLDIELRCLTESSLYTTNLCDL